MPDLFTWLTARYIEEHATSDNALQWLDLQLQDSDAGEPYLLEQYLALRNDELQSMPGPVHAWFLERWALAGPGTDNPERVSEIAGRIATMYLMAGPGTHQAAAVAALLSFDREWDREPSHVLRIWSLVAGNLPPGEGRMAVLAPLVETLLDLIFLTTEPATVLRALRDLLQRDGQVRPIIAERVALVGEGPLTTLLAGF